MRLQRIDLERSRGLNSAIRLDDLSPRFNVIVGSNGSGKSSLCRAVAALLWDTDDFHGAVSAQWSVSDGDFSATRESGAGPRWTKAGEPQQPPIPDKRFRRCFTLSVDDFLTDGDTDDEIRREISKELAAGFDLSIVLADRKRHSAASGAVTVKASALIKASGEAERVRDDHRELLRDEKRLELSLSELDTAAQAQRDVSLYAAALELAEARVALAASAFAMEGFPEQMSELRGDEQQVLEEKRAQLIEAEDDLERAKQAACEAQNALDETGLTAAVPEEDLKLILSRVKNLRTIEAELKAASDAEAQAAAQLIEARNKLRSEGVAQNRSELGPERWKQLEGHLRDLEAVEAGCAQLEAELEDLPADKSEATEVVPLERAISTLSSWLESGDARTPHARLQVMTSGGIGALLVLLGAVGAISAATFISVGLALVTLAIWQWIAGRGSKRGQWEQEFESLGLVQPSSWSSGAVSARLSELLDELEEQRRAVFRHEVRVSLERKLRKREEERAVLRAQLGSISADCGLSEEVALLGLVEISRALGQQTEATNDLASAQAHKGQTQTQGASERDRANEVLARYLVEGADDAEGLRSRHDGLASRENARSQASRLLAAAHADGERFAKQLSKRTKAVAALIADLGLGDEGESHLAHMLEARAGWVEAREAFDEARRRVGDLELRLEKHPALLQFEIAEAQHAQIDNAEHAKRYEPLTEHVADVRTKIEKARKGHELEEALASEEMAREALLDSREELFESAAAEFLLDSVARDHQNLSQPDILRRASEWFGEFTRHRYSLSLAGYSGDEKQVFEVQESGGATKKPNDLSSGTLSQLCLALRLSVAQSVEEGEELPLFLDEALTNSDPVRFREVVRSLAELAESGRQIFFLTSDPTDAARLSKVLEELDFEPAREFNLDEVRAGDSAAETLEVQAIASVPAPQPGELAAAYAERLAVPEIDPFAGVDLLHPFYLCREDLDGLHQLLCERVDTVGASCKLFEAHQAIWTIGQRERFQAQRSVAAAFLDHYQIGRAARLDPEILREGPTGKTVYIDRLVEVAAEFDGDAKALIEALERKGKDRDKRLKGFKRNKIDELRSDLEERGLFAPEEPLSAETREERCLSSAESLVERKLLTREDVVQLANAFEQWLL
ncbi:MAG: exonuclease SbcC [Planctomycetota bacterium]|jgi:exonuclease SbcC